MFTNINININKYTNKLKGRGKFGRKMWKRRHHDKLTILALWQIVCC